MNTHKGRVMNKIISFIVSCMFCSCLSAQSHASYKMGTSLSPSGETWTVDSLSLLFNGKRIIPVMGEIHYTRVPETQWRSELLKMKAGGINIIATYVFWIHHEEIKGQYDWKGNHNLRKFVELCKELNLSVALRVGPFCHGEVRNGGFPDWITRENYKIRTNDKNYLNEVRSWYGAIFNQVKGLQWKDGGPVICMQIENEYGGSWEHLKALKDMATDIGFDLPLYTRTGWPKLKTPAKFGELIPMYGDYCDGFWDRNLTDMPGSYSDCYFFRSYRGSTVIATEQIKNQSKEDSKGEWVYPFFTCELGGGMMPSYHRRIYVHPMDVYSLSLVKIGNGSNLPGYYMYHGGTNPEGKLTTLNETQRTLMTNYNDLPVKTYDFQAPIGEFGQLNEQYHWLRRLHLFLHDFGDKLALMNPVFPIKADFDKNWDKELRWCYRIQGNSGYVFANNYQRLKNLSKKESVRFSIPLGKDTLLFPSHPIDVRSGLSFILPFHMPLASADLVYATAQPITSLTVNGVYTYVFAKLPGIPAEFSFDAASVKALEGAYVNSGKSLIVENVKTGTDACIKLNDKEGHPVQIILLDEDTSLKCWKGTLAGKDRLFIAGGSLMCDREKLIMEDAASDFSVSIYPSPQSLFYKGNKVKSSENGIFTEYEVKTGWPLSADVITSASKSFGTLRTIPQGIAHVAEEPTNADFKDASSLLIRFPNIIKSITDRRAILSISYKADVARLYAGNQLLDDNFYNGRPFLYDLSRLSATSLSKGLTLKILPMQKNAPIYIQKEFQFDTDKENSIKQIQVSFLNKIELQAY